MSGNSPEYRREYEKETRALLKRLHMCRSCGEQDAYTLNGRTVCAECAAKQAEAKRNAYHADGGQKDRENHKALKDRRKAAHKCTRCGRSLPDGYALVTCESCRAKANKFSTATRRKRGIPTWEERCADGWCFICNKHPAIEGKKMCQECYDKNVMISLKNLEKTRGSHPWKNLKIGKGLSKANSALKNTERFIRPPT